MSGAVGLHPVYAFKCGQGKLYWHWEGAKTAIDQATGCRTQETWSDSSKKMRIFSTAKR